MGEIRSPGDHNLAPTASNSPSALGVQRILLAVFLVAGAPACTTIVDLSDINGSSTALKTWRDPVALDTTLPGVAASINSNDSATFTDFRADARGNVAAVVGAYHSNASATTARAVGEVYRPRSSGGSGWTTGQSSTLDSGNAVMKNVALGFKSTGDILAVFSNGTQSQTGSGLFSESTQTWGNALSTITGTQGVQVSLASQGTIHPLNGHSTSIAWDQTWEGAFLGYVDSAGSVRVHFYREAIGWDPNQPDGQEVGTGTDQVQLLDDGFGVTALWIGNSTSCTSGTCLHAAWSRDENLAQLKPYFGFTSVVSVPASTAGPFSAATDGKGNIMVVFVQSDPAIAASSCSTTTNPVSTSCEMRVFAAIRNTAGVWTGPTRLDDAFANTTTTLKQDGRGTFGASAWTVEPRGGVFFATPAVAYAGSQKFVTAFAVNNSVARTSGLYSRTYTLGTGWDSTTGVLETTSLQETSSGSGAYQQYRIINDMTMTGNGDGEAILAVQRVQSNGGTYATRKLGVRVYHYSTSTGFSASEDVGASYACPAGPIDPPINNFTAFCWNQKPWAYLFPSGDGLLVFAAPESAGSKNWKLFYQEFY